MTRRGRVAAFLAEPIRAWADSSCRRKNISRDRRHHPQIRRLFIADEVQTGWAAPAVKMFGIEHWASIPTS